VAVNQPIANIVSQKPEKNVEKKHNGVCCNSCYWYGRYCFNRRIPLKPICTCFLDKALEPYLEIIMYKVFK
jgi:hypothetical protein